MEGALRDDTNPAARETNNNAAEGGKSIKYETRSEFLGYQCM